MPDNTAAAVTSCSLAANSACRMPTASRLVFIPFLTIVRFLRFVKSVQTPARQPHAEHRGQRAEDEPQKNALEYRHCLASYIIIVAATTVITATPTAVPSAANPHAISRSVALLS